MPGQLRRHQERNVRCRAYRVLKRLESLGFSLLQVNDPLQRRFRVYPSEYDEVERVLVHWHGTRPPWIEPYKQQSHVILGMPSPVRDLYALERPALGPEGMARAYGGPWYVGCNLRYRAGVWVHASIAFDLARALEHAMAEEIIAAGGVVPYRKCHKHHAESLGLDWFSYRMGSILWERLRSMNLSTFIERYRQGPSLAEVPDMPNDTRVTCPYCGKKVSPRRLIAHQKLVPCIQARYRKEGRVPVASIGRGAADLIVLGLGRFGIDAKRLLFKDRWEYEIWTPGDQADLARRLISVALDQIDSEASFPSGADAVKVIVVGDKCIKTRWFSRPAYMQFAEKLTSGDELALLVAVSQSEVS